MENQTEVPPLACCSLKSKLMCVSAGLIVLIIVAIASFVLGRALPRGPEGTLRGTPTTAILPTPTPTPDETANWKTYTNEKYGFTLKYPPEWSIDDKKLNIINLGPLSTKNHIGETIPEYVSSYIVLSLFNSTQNTDLKTFKNLNPAVNPIWKEIMIDEINGLDVQHKGCVSGSCREILFQKDNTIYNFSEQNNLKELNQILSTLMFTN